MSTHKNFFTFNATSNYDLGLQFGETFKEHLVESIEKIVSTADYKDKQVNGLEYLSYSRKYFPHLVEELEGYAKGAGVSFNDLWTLSLEDELSYYKPEKCTTVITNNGKLVSHNEDWSTDAQDTICVVKKQINDLTIFELFYMNTLGGNSVSINSHGYVQSINTLTHTDWQLGVPRNVLCRWMSETASPTADFTKLKSIKRSLGYNHVLVGKDGGIFNIECSSKTQELTEPGSPFFTYEPLPWIFTTVRGRKGNARQLNIQSI